MKLKEQADQILDRVDGGEEISSTDMQLLERYRDQVQKCARGISYGPLVAQRLDRIQTALVERGRVEGALGFTDSKIKVGDEPGTQGKPKPQSPRQGAPRPTPQPRGPRRDAPQPKSRVTPSRARSASEAA